MTTRAPRVVHLPGNEVVGDARVLKYLATTARWGLETVAVGVTRRGVRRDLRIGEARVVVVPVAEPSVTRSPLRVLTSAVRDPEAFAEARALTTRLRSRAGRIAGPRRVLLRAVVLGARVWLRVVAAVRRTDRPLTERQRRARIDAYRRRPRTARWREVLPVVVEDERAVGPVLDELEPDLVHVHDVFMLGAAAAAVRRARERGRSVRLVYDAHEYIPGLAVLPPRTIGAYAALEREFIGDADRVVTVSEPLADALLADHDLARRPAVVLNAPTVVEPPAGFRTVRQVVGLDDDVPLLVYAGGVNRARGVDTAVAALGDLPGVHLVLVANKNNLVVQEALAQARASGVGDRVHTAPFVAPELVVPYVASATVGLSTLLRAPNHDVAVTNKFCEYLLAGLPIVTSDTPAQADLVREHRLGEVYTAGDAADLVRATRRVLEDLDALRARVRGAEGLGRRFSWSAQAAVIRDLYGELLGELPERAWAPDALAVGRVSAPAE